MTAAAVVNVVLVCMAMLMCFIRMQCFCVRLQTWRPVTWVRKQVASAPGTVDFLMLLAAMHRRCQPKQTVLQRAQTHMKASLEPVQSSVRSPCLC